MRRSSLGLYALAGLLPLLASACIFGLDLPGDEGRPCGPGDTCLTGYECVAGICERTPIGAPCELDEDCAEGFCWFSFETDDFCTHTCSTSADCLPGFRCSEADSLDHGGFVCLPPAALGGSVGTGGLGDACSGADDCQSGLCQGQICIDTCQNQSDCGTDGALECQIASVGGSSEARCLPPASSGAAQGEYCDDGTDCARGNCADDGFGGGVCADPCCSMADCPSGTICWLVLWSGWEPGQGLARSCVEYEPLGGYAFGENCSDHSDCLTGTCLVDPNNGQQACTDTCCTDADCPAGYRCELLDYDVDDDGSDDSKLPHCVTLP